ncbi:MAG: hypothetical protein WCZ89_02345 [Phycisphaerae bacterium]
MIKKIITVWLLISLNIGLVLSLGGCENNTNAEMENLRRQINTVTVNITNSNGSISQVNLTKHGIGFVGPRGEYYETMPTEDQLKPIYGF